MAAIAYQVRAIFETLPTGYYLGRPIKVTLSDTSKDSFYNVISDEITISAPTIIETATEANLEGEDLEELIRGLFYHEISHAILTGPHAAEAEQYWNASQRSHTLFNIVEDERIETILKDYYMKVNFKKNIFLITKFDGHKPKNMEEAFYMLTRYHIGHAKWLNRMENLLKQYSHLNAASDQWKWRDFQQEIDRFYKEFANEPENLNPPMPQQGQGQQGQGGQGNQSKQSQNGQGNGQQQPQNQSKQQNNGGNGNQDQNSGNDQQQQNGSGDQQSQNGAGNDQQDQQQNGGGSQTGDEEAQDQNGAGAGANDQNGNEEGVAQSQENKDAEEKAAAVPDFKIPGTGRGLENSIMKEALNAVTNKFVNAKIVARLQKMINESQKKKGMYSGFRRTYSGRIDPRACDREDCRFWTRQSVNSSNKMYSKIHFNLFIDHSGSFDSCNAAINELLRALYQVISPDFEFDVITIDTEIVEWDRPDQYVFEANGGTNLTNKIGPIFKKHQKRGCNNYNIVVFDGDAHGRGYSQAEEPFNHFDTPNTVLVVDSDNADYIKHLTACKKKVINNNYAEHFIEEVLTLLERII